MCMPGLSVRALCSRSSIQPSYWHFHISKTQNHPVYAYVSKMSLNVTTQTEILHAFLFSPSRIFFYKVYDVEYGKDCGRCFRRDTVGMFSLPSLREYVKISYVDEDMRLTRQKSHYRTIRYGLDDWGFESRKGLGIFVFTAASRPALGNTQPPVQWVPKRTRDLVLGILRVSAG
jgi:hypothetical protein